MSGTNAASRPTLLDQAPTHFVVIETTNINLRGQEVVLQTSIALSLLRKFFFGHKLLYFCTNEI